MLLMVLVPSALMAAIRRAIPARISGEVRRKPTGRAEATERRTEATERGRKTEEGSRETEKRSGEGEEKRYKISQL